MSVPLCVLHIEDSESDAAMIVRQLQKADYEVQRQRVETAADLRAALARQTWDVVICDYQMPQLNAPAALTILRESGLDIPFIVVSGTIGEDTAVTMMKTGASDYLMKDKLERLAPAVARELAEAHDRQARRTAEAETEKLQAQLLQAQKMELVGRLAGGVAHDFNNMLAVIMGFVEVAMEQVGPAHPIHPDLEQIRLAAHRSADLTGQLLAFARKQAIRPRVLDLNDTVASVLKMLQRLIGEEVDLLWKPGTGLWPVKVDPGQIDQVLANLAINARDAIAGVGKLTIETDNVVLDDAYCGTHLGSRPGAYVLLMVSDSGAGMDKATMGHIFEPFFTTKELGKGSGLGCATVYGIVKQNNGFISVYSEPGHGTTFKIYLPRSQAEPASPAVVEAGKPARGNETILVVEDEKALLDLSRTILQRCGYTVLSALNPAEAIGLVQRHDGPIHLLLTDVVMPEMNGKQLRAALATLRPGIKVMFMSGYTAEVIAHQGVLEEGIHFLQKPFSVTSLTAKVREVLDA